MRNKGRRDEEISLDLVKRIDGYPITISDNGFVHFRKPVQIFAADPWKNGFVDPSQNLVECLFHEKLI